MTPLLMTALPMTAPPLPAPYLSAASAATNAPLPIGHVVVLAMLWLVTVWRLPAAVRNPRQRMLWTAFAGVTIMVTLGLPNLTAWVDATAGVHNIVVPIKHVISLVACAAMVAFVAETARPELAPRLRRPQLVVLLAAQLGLVVSFALIRQSSEVTDFYQAYPGSVPAAIYALIVACYLGSAMGVASWLFGTYALRAGAGWLRSGLWVLGVGTAAGFGYSVLRVCQVLLALFDQPMFLSASLLYGIEWLAIALVLLGSSLPAVGVALDALRAWRTVRGLRPLWASLTAAVPEVVLTAPLGRSPRVLLHRRVIEIRDAALVLAGYADDELRARAARAAEHASAGDSVQPGGPATGPAGGPVADLAPPERPRALTEALTEALWLRATCAQRLAGQVPAGGPAAEVAGSFADLDFETETCRVLRLAAAYHSPVADAFAHAETDIHAT
ncbi:MAB_1171c family putative transporter [Kitasatospora kifunensis]|uniref:DUF6545 domain-containing protein n=1 Tax=Kitasatospora kifunensis TaxID=58351 RepID=A0A7W7VW49_KITKI|nr:MAB_1171c family putative transporter [Kitasatospora kifunensis]MBB4924329.1 hypothetical protein [Kitasatospora kifunensis]